jgi:hypothetical protein
MCVLNQGSELQTGVSAIHLPYRYAAGRAEPCRILNRSRPYRQFLYLTARNMV